MIGRWPLQKGGLKMKTSWPVKKLGEVAEINPRKSEVKDLSDTSKVSFVPMRAVDAASGEIENPEVRGLGEVKNGYTCFKENDVLFAKITPCMQNGKFAITKNLVNGIGFGSTEFHVIRLSKRILPEWIYLLLRQKSFREEAERHMTGTAGQQRVPKEYLENLEIPMPAIEEQKRIVAKLEKILKPQEIADGQLDDVDQLFRSSCSVAFSEINDSSKMVLLGEVCDVVKGKSPTLKTPKGKYPLVVTAESRRTSDEYQFDTVAVCVPLISSSGHGHADIKRIHYQEGKFALANIMAAITPQNSSTLSPRFLYYYLDFYKERLVVPLMGGSANVTVPIDSLGTIKIPLPSINKQTTLVEKLRRIDQLKKELTERRLLMDEMFNSSSHAAFQGESI